MKKESTQNNRESIYKNNVIATRSKSFLGQLANLGLILVLSGILFVLFKLIGDNIPIVKEYQDISVLKEKEYGKEAEKAGLIFVENGERLELEDIAFRAITSETKSAVIHHGMEEEYKHFPIYEGSFELNEGSYINNPMLYYYCEYKVQNLDFYEKNTAELNYFLKFYDEQFVNNKEKTFFEPNENNVQRYLTKENTKLLADYLFKEDRYESNQKLHDEFNSSLIKTYKQMKEDFVKNNAYANNIIKQHDDAYMKYAESLIIELFIGYTVATFLTYMVPYFVKKDYGSVGDLILKTPIVSLKGNKMNFWQELGSTGINYISNVYVIFLLILFIFGNPGLATHSFGIFNVAILSIFGGIFSIISLLLMIFMKNHQYIDVFSLLCERKFRDETLVIEDKKEEENGK